jgi:DNA primase catalytic core
LIAQESIERVKSEANIVEVVSETVQLRRAGMYFSGLCPFHSEKSPSFFVRDSSNTYTCFGCGAAGNVISFVMATRAMTFPDAVEYLASRFHIELKRDKVKGRSGPAVDREKLFAISRAAFIYFRQSLTKVRGGTGEFKIVGEYLKKRGLTADAINGFGIGYSPVQRGALISVLRKDGFDDESILMTGLVRRSASGELYELFRGRLIFPIFVDSSRIAAFGGRLVPGVLEANYEEQAPKYLNSPESPLYQKSRTIYGLPQAMEGIRASKEVYVVEGYMDVVGLWIAGVRNVVACCGTAMTEQHIKRFSGVCSRIHLLFDGDSAGRGAAAKSFLVSRNAPVDLAVCFLPDGVDPDDLARTHGGDTQEALKGLPRAELIDVFVDGLFTKYGCSLTEKPGANLLGKLCDEVAKALSAVESEVARTALTLRAARRLGVDAQQLHRLTTGQGRGQEHGRKDIIEGKGAVDHAQSFESEGAFDEEGASGELSLEPGALRPIEQLPPTDVEILRAVMVLKQEILPDLIRNAGLCAQLQPEVVRFASELFEVFKSYPDDEAQQRVVVRALLSTYGASWLELWKDAYLRVQSGVQMKEVYQGSLKAMTLDRLGRLAAEIKRESVEAGDDEEKQTTLSQRDLSIQRKIQEARNSGG